MLYTVSEAVCPLPERHTPFTTLPKVVEKVSLGESKSWEKFHFGDLIIRFLGSPVNLELLRISQLSGLLACPEFAPFPLFTFCGVGRGWCAPSEHSRRFFVAYDAAER